MKKLCLYALTALLMLTGCSSNNAPEEEMIGTEDVLFDMVNESSGEMSEDFFFANHEIPQELLDEIENDRDSDVIEIRDKLFIAQINDIFINTENYLGKTLKYQGLFDYYYWEETDLTYYNVIRYGPGCCGMDGYVGFEVIWDNDYPELNDWVEVTGILESYEEFGYTYLRLQLISLEVLDERGQEFVYM